MYILLVDDDNDVRAAMGGVLADAGHDVTQAENGREAVSMAVAMKFDLGIVDIFMPTMDGLETIRHFHRYLPRLPILAISGLRLRGGASAPRFLNAAIEFGAICALSKPFCSRELLCAVGSIDHLVVADTAASASTARCDRSFSSEGASAPP
ncbi:response regulator [Rhodopseudomonas palustris]|uniref:response regulator n=1 Tax=Rhodopseudomonas palustris TaxID=1076 RepID=UPI002ACD31BC|nr:response regulator [Rhodopseudomonas palustris]WQG99806.1 response regulator [Rhodopseudomonas palustris]